mmetsp:Transcript_12007/g.28058  ORF Transcript_12007/g.28058 Transcript_12007/m.28058 type:complete len:250 (-) Transcript_12007:385-1134(-)
MAATKTKTTTKTKSAQPTKEERPPLWKVWFVASRPHTLTASISPNIVAYHAGVALFERAASGDAHGHGHAHVPVPAFSSYEYGWLTLKWTAFCMLMQLGTNLHNDYADFVKGADNEKRVGQARATQKGWLTPFQTAAASGGTLLLGLLLGLGFVADLATGQSQSALPLPLPTTACGPANQRSNHRPLIIIIIIIVAPCSPIPGSAAAAKSRHWSSTLLARISLRSASSGLRSNRAKTMVSTTAIATDST